MKNISYSLLLVAACAALPAHGAELGRLFFTPDQRDRLEYQYARTTNADGSGNHSFIMVNGVVQKQGGKRTVWINGAAQQTSNNERNPGTVPVTVPGKPHPVPIKVGDRLILERPAPDTAP